MLNRRDFVRAASGLLVPGALTLARNPRGAVSGSPLPAAAIAAGFTTQTFGPNLTLGTNWYYHNFYGAGGGATQNGNGISIDGTTTYGICSAQSLGSGNWAGTCFGGGGYFEATLSFPPSLSSDPHHPAFWSQDIEILSKNAVSLSTQWPGQASNYGDWLEPDFFELFPNSITTYAFGIHNWYATVGSSTQVVTSPTDSGSPASIGGALWTNPNQLGCLWIPATPTTQGSLSYFFNRVQLGNTIFWNKYDPSAAPPPVKGSSAYSVLDIRHLAMVLNTSLNCAPMQVYAMSVYQGSGADNITGNLTTSTTSPLPGATHGSPYSQAITFAGGTAPYTDTLIAKTGTNTWNFSAGSITGTPSTAETDYVTVKRTDSVGKSWQGTFQIVVA